MSDPIPPHLQGPMAAFESALASLRTRRIRAEAMEIPESPPVEPEKLAESAARPDAPDKLKQVAKAVEEGRATWDDVANGRTGVAPEIKELFAASGPGIQRGIAEAEEQEARLAEEAARQAEIDDDDDDFDGHSFLRGG